VPDSAYMLATVCARQGIPPIRVAFVHPEAVAGMIVSDVEMVRRVKPEAYEAALGSGMTAVVLADGTGLETFRGPIIGKEIAAIQLRYKDQSIDSQSARDLHIFMIADGALLRAVPRGLGILRCVPVQARAHRLDVGYHGKHLASQRVTAMGAGKETPLMWDEALHHVALADGAALVRELQIPREDSAGFDVMNIEWRMGADMSAHWGSLGMGGPVRHSTKFSGTLHPCCVVLQGSLDKAGLVPLQSSGFVH
jgi:hypothetical protein